MRKGNGYREAQFKARVPALLRAQDKTFRQRGPKRNNPNLSFAFGPGGTEPCGSVAVELSVPRKTKKRRSSPRLG
jgi:hypothetical protein